MKKKSSNPGAPPLTDDEVEHIAYTALRDSAKLFPKSIDDLETLESEIEGAGLPKPNMPELLKMLRGDLPEPKLILKGYGVESAIEVTESLALAARHGTDKITSDIRAKMDADRTAAERAKEK